MISLLPLLAVQGSVILLRTSVVLQLLQPPQVTTTLEISLLLLLLLPLPLEEFFLQLLLLLPQRLTCSVLPPKQTQPTI